MVILVEAKVYKTSHGKRYLTKRGAYLAEAMHRLKRNPLHEKQGFGEYEDYFTDDQWSHFKEVAQRYYRRFGKGNDMRTVTVAAHKRRVSEKPADPFAATIDARRPKFMRKWGVKTTPTGEEGLSIIANKLMALAVEAGYKG